jgi:predicted ATPase
MPQENVRVLRELVMPILRGELIVGVIGVGK